MDDGELIRSTKKDRSEGIHTTPIRGTRFPVRCEVLDRFRCIETLLSVEGTVRSNDLSHFFGITRPQASRAVTNYRRENPSAMTYSEKVKAYVANPCFETRYITDPKSEYLHLILRNKLISSIWRDLSTEMPGVDCLNELHTYFDRDIFATVLRAIRWHRIIKFQYIESVGEKISYVDLSAGPTQMVHTCKGWLVRTIDEMGGARNIWLNRITDLPQMGKSFITANDPAWDQEVDVKAHPREDLTPDERILVIADWGSGNTYTRRTRKALARVLAEQWQALDPRLEVSVDI